MHTLRFGFGPLYPYHSGNITDTWVSIRVSKCQWRNPEKCRQINHLNALRILIQRKNMVHDKPWYTFWYRDMFWTFVCLHTWDITFKSLMIINCYSLWLGKCFMYEKTACVSPLLNILCSIAVMAHCVSPLSNILCSIAIMAHCLSPLSNILCSIAVMAHCLSPLSNILCSIAVMAHCVLPLSNILCSIAVMAHNRNVLPFASVGD